MCEFFRNFFLISSFGAIFCVVTCHAAGSYVTRYINFAYTQKCEDFFFDTLFFLGSNMSRGRVICHAVGADWMSVGNKLKYLVFILS
jgi:hypothetical protein